ncbi:cytochrome P450 [Nocardia arizonensis]|uniref:cytochrome P450 n=1 Tax=Nocardia arizonensis TaxID=1141647 RepID=UPI0006D09A57|nr:cytochrome P450 [Nocardia arizonensis]
MELGKGVTTALLLANPEQAAVAAVLRDSDDPAVIDSAVEELLRFLTVVHHGRRRVALADIEIGDVRVEAGEGLILAIETANRDPRAFPGDPDVLDIRRNARNHLAFAFGPHQCLGRTLARMELQVAYGTLFRRLPSPALAAPVGSVCSAVPVRCRAGQSAAVAEFSDAGGAGSSLMRRMVAEAVRCL